MITVGDLSLRYHERCTVLAFINSKAVGIGRTWRFTHPEAKKRFNVRRSSPRTKIYLFRHPEQRKPGRLERLKVQYKLF